jgi:uncharacterized protein (DUF1800 family)
MAGITIDPIAHLYRRAGFGAMPAELEAGRQRGYAATLDQILKFDAVPDAAEAVLAQYAPQFDLNNAVTVGAGLQMIQAGWLIRMLSTSRPLVEKLTLFWHGHFATAISKVKDPAAMLAQNNLFRSRGMGKFRDLLLAVSQDPAMLFWLDSNTNRRGHPNENYARELMELFTMGIGHYTETDVQEAARAFTGWFVARVGNQLGSFKFRPELHDYDPKKVLEQTGDWNGNDIVDILAVRPETAEFISRKLWAWFIHDHPTDADIKSLVQLYLAKDTEIRPLVEAILKHPAFTSDDAYLAQVKSPVEFGVGALRALPGSFNPFVLPAMLRQMGQELFNPPNVKGWDGGMDWISTTTLLARVNFANGVTSARGTGTGKQNLGAGINTSALLSGSNVTTAAELVDLLAARLGPVPINEGSKAEMAAYVGAPGGLSTLTLAQLDTKVRGLVHLIMGTAEYQMA